jgi:hypothetical protein
VDNSSDETGFRLERAEGLDFKQGLIAFNVDPNPGVGGVLSLSDHTVKPDITYFYRVFAINHQGSSTPSNTVQVSTVRPLAPTNLTAVALSPTRVRLQWADDSKDGSTFTVNRALDAAFMQQQVNFDRIPAGSTEFFDTTTQPGALYFYRVVAVNPVGVSAFSNAASVDTGDLAAVPAAPTDLKASAASSAQVDLTWLGNASDATSYQLDRSRDAAFGTVFHVVLPPDTVSFSDTGVVPTETYYYRVHAVNASGDSAFSNVVSVTTPAAIPAASSAPVMTLQSSSKSPTHPGFKLSSLQLIIIVVVAVLGIILAVIKILLARRHKPPRNK